jgi:hypothetical protein
MLGITKRADGTEQVTYNGHPLYYFEGDKKSGTIAGQGLDAFGAEWYVVGATGSKVEKGEARERQQERLVLERRQQRLEQRREAQAAVRAAVAATSEGGRAKPDPD